VTLTPTETAMEMFLEALVIKHVPPGEQHRLKPHLRDTHKRVAKMFDTELLKGYSEDPKSILRTAFDEEEYDQIVLIKDIEFHSICAHHLLGFEGTAAVAYLPNGRVVGLSKLGRLVECFARRFQIQERMTEDIARAMMEFLKPKACAVIIEASHSCMSCRGIQKAGALTVTSRMYGLFKTEPETKAELMDLIYGGKR
jgi:GTP cyclohydrolase I